MTFFCSGGERAPSSLINETYNVALSLERQAVAANAVAKTPSQAKAIKSLQKQAFALLGKIKNSKDPSPSYKKIGTLSEQTLTKLLLNMRRVQEDLANNGCQTRASHQDVKVLGELIGRLQHQLDILHSCVETHKDELPLTKKHEIETIIRSAKRKVEVTAESDEKNANEVIETLSEHEVRNLQRTTTDYVERTTGLINEIINAATITTPSPRPIARFITVISPAIPVKPTSVPPRPAEKGAAYLLAPPAVTMHDRGPSISDWRESVIEPEDSEVGEPASPSGSPRSATEAEPTPEDNDEPTLPGMV